MSFIPRLRRPIRSDSNTPTKKPVDRVRFNTEPITLTEEEKRRRRADAYDYLRSQNHHETIDGVSSRLRSSVNTEPPYNERPRSILKNSPTKRTYELMGESPIRYIPNPDRLGTERVLQSVRSEASRSSPLLHRSDYRINKPTHQKRERKGLLDSLSSVGSRLLSSVLFNEKTEDTKLQEAVKQNTGNTRVHRWNEEELRRIRQSDDLEKTIKDRQEALERLNREISLKNLEKQVDVGHPNLEGKFDVLQRMISELKDHSGEKVVSTELETIKQELLSMKKRQENNTMKFESKMEELQLEAELDKKLYKRMMKDLEDKRREVEEEKDKLIRVLRQQARRKRKRHESDSDDSGSEEEEDSGSDESDRGDDEYKRRKVGSKAVRIKLNRMTKKMKSLERDVSQNRDEAEHLRNDL